MMAQPRYLLLPLLAAALSAAPASAFADDAGPDGGPTDEVCNGIDDDLDGLTDEELDGLEICSNSQTDDPYEGICVEGWLLCLGGEWVCNANEPMPEICDGKDNDCDGMSDEDLDVECPFGPCFWGQCVDYCWGDKALCPVGLSCEYVDEYGDYFCVPEPCYGDPEEQPPCCLDPCACDVGFEPPCVVDFWTRACVNVCFGIDCPFGEVCVPEDDGKCHSVEHNCYVSGCPPGDICVDKECVPDPCHGVLCTSGSYCNAHGECVPPCVDVDCPDCQGCYEGECVDDPCAGVECYGGLQCWPDGECHYDVCWNMTCPFYQVCEDGECVHDPCWNIECPDCTMVCHDGACYDELEEGQWTDLNDENDCDYGEEGDDTDDTDDGPLGDTDAGDDDGAAPGMKNVLVTGAGGCLCSGAPGAAGRSGWLLRSLLSAMLW